MHGTYTVPEWYNQKPGFVSYPGIGNGYGSAGYTVQKYYQWVSIVLFLQALAFYIPRTIWKSIENNRIRDLMGGLEKPLIAPAEQKGGVEALLYYFKYNIGHHNRFYIGYVFCELLNLFNVLLQIQITDVFLGNVFTTLGLELYNYYAGNVDEFSTEPLLKVFPRMTKCQYRSYGPSGDVTKSDTTCTLPLNVINEKIYLCLWFWLWIVTILSTVNICYRIATFASPWLRKRFLNSRAGAVDPQELDTVFQSCSVGDWFIM